MSNGDVDTIKKRMCNPPAEQMALHGDTEVAGLFMGAGKAIDQAEKTSVDKKALSYFRREMIKTEEEYVKARKELAERFAKACKASYEKFLKGIGYDGPEGY